MLRNKTLPFLLGILLLALFLTAAVLPQIFTAYGQKEMFDAWEKPVPNHLLGTNALGYDVFTELVYGTRDTLFIGLMSSIFTLLLGMVIGTLAAQSGLTGGLFDGIINVFILLPRLITLIVLSAFIGTGRWHLIALIALFGWAPTARAVRERVKHLRVQPFVEALTVQGFSRLQIAIRHMLPNLAHILLTRFLLGVNSCIMMESTLSFLGFGDLYHPTWGTMINLAYRRGAFLRQAYAYLLVPGLCIVLLSLSFYLISLWFSKRKEIIAESNS